MTTEDSLCAMLNFIARDLGIDPHANINNSPIKLTLSIRRKIAAIPVATFTVISLIDSTGEVIADHFRVPDPHEAMKLAAVKCGAGASILCAIPGFHQVTPASETGLSAGSEDLAVDLQCSVCEQDVDTETTPYAATPCGTFCECCMVNIHAKDCLVCRKEFNIEVPE